MIQGFYSTKNVLLAQQTNIDTIANNISNIDTNGFKGNRVAFKDALYNAMPSGDLMPSSANRQTGTGVVVSATRIINSQGTIISSENPQDFAIQGSGYFTLMNGNGEKFYTRNGMFQASEENGKEYLVTTQGYYVLGKDGNKISMTENLKEKLNVVTFPNPEGLQQNGGNNYSSTVASGLPVLSADGIILQGKYEASNVDLAQEMTRLIRASKAFSLASKVITVADEMEATTNSLRT